VSRYLTYVFENWLHWVLNWTWPGCCSLKMAVDRWNM